MARVDRFKQFMSKIEEAHDKVLEISPSIFGITVSDGENFKGCRRSVCAIGAFVINTKIEAPNDWYGYKTTALRTNKSIHYADGISSGFFGKEDFTKDTEYPTNKTDKESIIAAAKDGGFENPYDRAEGIRLGFRLHAECVKRGWL